MSIVLSELCETSLSDPEVVETDAHAHREKQKHTKPQKSSFPGQSYSYWWLEAMDLNTHIKCLISRSSLQRFRQLMRAGGSRGDKEKGSSSQNVSQPCTRSSENQQGVCESKTPWSDTVHNHRVPTGCYTLSTLRQAARCHSRLLSASPSWPRLRLSVRLCSVSVWFFLIRQLCEETSDCIKWREAILLLTSLSGLKQLSACTNSELSDVSTVIISRLDQLCHSLMAWFGSCVW